MAAAQDHSSSLNNWLDSPELQALREEWRQEECTIKAEDQAWWDSLSMEERARALRQVTKLMHKAEVEDQGSYRYAMYDIFEVDYLDGILCPYMELHNLIHRGLQAAE